MNENRKIYLPIIFLLTWLISTVLVFNFGPYDYKITNTLSFYVYLTFIHIAIFLGYFWGQTFEGQSIRVKINYFKLVERVISVAVLYVGIKLLLTGGGELRNFFQTFQDANLSYIDRNVRAKSIFTYLDIFFVPVIIFAITNTLFCYGKLSRWYRYSIYVLLLIIFCSAVGLATRSNIVKTGMISMAALTLGIYAKNLVLKPIHKIIIAGSVVAYLMAFFLYFAMLIENRDLKNIVVLRNPMTKELPKENYFLYEVTPPRIHVLIKDVAFYMSHAYYRLNQSFELPTKGYGLGLSHSYFVMDNIEQYTGLRWLKEISYPLRLDKQSNIIFGMYWTTFYSWIASDFSFPGTVVVVFLISLALSVSLKDALFEFNPFAVSAFCTLFYFIFFFSFNNPMQDGQGITTFFCIPLVWLILRKGFLKRKNVS